MHPIEALWVLFIGCSVVIIIVVHISFAVAIFRDATYLPSPRNSRRKPIFVGRTIWFLATLLGGIFVATIYWIMHHSRLNPSVPAPPPEN